MFVFFATSCFSQIIKKQVSIPLNNINGVPYHHWKIEDLISGFDVDSKGNYYFIDINDNKGTTTLASFNGTKQKYRKTYNLCVYGQLDDIIKVDSNRIYLVDSYKKNFYTLDNKDGKIVNEQKIPIKGIIGFYVFLDSAIVLGGIDSTDPSNHRWLLNYQGILLCKTGMQNLHTNFPDSLIKTDSEGVQFLGQWKELKVFFRETIESGGQMKYRFYFVNLAGKIVGVSSVDNKVFSGYWLCFAEDRVRKLKNGIIYIVVGKKEGKNALITELSVEELYKDAVKHRE